jgi:predicted DCC family thiol-disulfide oxidoreductase YuxK
VPSTGCYPHSVLTLAKTALPIVFYDGDCGMCTQSVDLILRADRRNVFWFAPLQGETARELLPPLPADPAQWSMVLVDEAGIHRESDAALRICRRLPGAWRLLGLLLLVPRFLRDGVYRLVARNRYRVFGRKDSCRIATAAERARFLP